MRLCLALLVVVACYGGSQLDAQTSPLWSEQKVKNFLPHMTWTDVRDLLTRTDMVLVPVPALEQHGFHGPIGTDFYSGVEQSKLIAQRTDVLVAPILFVGQSPYHLEFPGTIALSADTLQRVYFEAIQNLINQGFTRVILYASHAGTSTFASYVADRLNQETRAVAVTLADGVNAMREQPPAQSTSTQPVPFDRHGGVGETSGALYLFPTLVQMNKAERATLTVPPALSSLPPLVATAIARRPWCFWPRRSSRRAPARGRRPARCPRPACGVNATRARRRPSKDGRRRPRSSMPRFGSSNGGSSCRPRQP